MGVIVDLYLSFFIRNRRTGVKTGYSRFFRFRLILAEEKGLSKGHDRLTIGKRKKKEKHHQKIYVLRINIIVRFKTTCLYDHALRRILHFRKVLPRRISKPTETQLLILLIPNKTVRLYSSSGKNPDLS